MICSLVNLLFVSHSPRHLRRIHASTGLTSGRRSEQLIDAIVPPTLARVAGQLEDFDDLVPSAKRALTTRLLGFGADGFVSMLKARTQESLDWIKVNGVITGALLGGAVGVVSALISGQSH
jgi:hypothetical protein